MTLAVIGKNVREQAMGVLIARSGFANMDDDVRDIGLDVAMRNFQVFYRKASNFGIERQFLRKLGRLGPGTQSRQNIFVNPDFEKINSAYAHFVSC
jgi:hypothetical protein